MNLSKLKNLIKDVDSALLEFISKQTLCQVYSWSWTSESDIPVGNDSTLTADVTEADVVTSLMKDTKFSLVDVHRPVLDIDFPVHVIESSTPGHYHLFLDRPMSAEAYFKLLGALAEAGIVEQGFANATYVRKASRVRLPWVKK